MATAFETAAQTVGLNNEVIGGLLATFDTNIDPIIRLLGAVAFLLGVWLLVKAIISIKDSRNGGGREGKTPLGIIVTFGVAILLINLPFAMDIFRESLFGSQVSPLSNVSKVGDFGSNATEIAKVIMHFIQAVGIGAFIRGIIVLNKVANGGGNDATVGKGMTFVLGGIFAVNIVTTVNLLSSSFGLNFAVS